MQNSPAHHEEPARQTPIVEHVDVVVAGGGPAGVAAALAAARTGASVRLIETHGCLGGIWTAGVLSWILDKDNKPGLMQTILDQLDAVGARRDNAYDAEVMKRLLERLCVEAGVSIRLHTHVVAAARDAENRLAVVITESKSGREAWAARTFIDCTGDGDLGAQVGCGFDLGREGTGQMQPMTLMCLVTGVDYHELNKRRFCRGDGLTAWEAKMGLAAELERLGIKPSYTHPTMFPIRDDLFGVMINHAYGYSSLDAQQLTDATLEARAELHDHFDMLRAAGGVWENVRIVATGEQIGVREGRRIRGRYVVTRDDLEQGKRHEDAVCEVTFPIDVHATERNKEGGNAIEKVPFKSKPYDVPFRSLIAADVDGLLLAGRCISGDFIAHSSYRVTGNAVSMGQAAGVAAAVAAKQGKLPHELDWQSEIKPALDTLIAGCPAASPEREIVE